MKKLSKVVIAFAFVLVFAGMACAAGMPGVFPAFSSKSLDGGAVNADIFSGKKLTMINIWATWCPPCVMEMPGLGNMGRSMPEGAQLIGLILDEDIDAAKRILSESNADFIQIFPSKEMAPVLNTVSAIPTTIFVDSAGKIVGAPLIGARSEKAYRAEVEKLLK
jgi:thiol-disulfide isomerase/thioredoxin